MVFSVTRRVAIRNLYGKGSPLVPFQSTWLVGGCAAVPPGVWALRAGGAGGPAGCGGVELPAASAHREPSSRSLLIDDNDVTVMKTWVEIS